MAEKQPERERPERTVRAVPRFNRAKGGLPLNLQMEIDNQVKRIVADPLIGDSKAGALSGVRVVKFKFGPQQYLIAYLFHKKRNVVEILDVGVHENFYRDLENYLKS